MPAQAIPAVPALEALIRAVAQDTPGVTPTGFAMRAFRGSTTVRLVASFAGRSDRDTVVNLSDDLAAGLTAEVCSPWTFEGSIQCDDRPRGFELSIHLQPVA
jgi:hypothetical protein